MLSARNTACFFRVKMLPWTQCCPPQAISLRVYLLNATVIFAKKCVRWTMFVSDILAPTPVPPDDC